MKISGFSYIRNGFNYEYPFLQSIQSILPICDEFLIAVGDSQDNTREAIINLNNSKIKIIDTIWDEKLRANGEIFAKQSNVALIEASGDWLFHLQADEVIHENDLNTIYQQIIEANKNRNVEGLLFNFLNFHGNYSYLNDSRYQHRKEIRAFRNDLNIYSYKDSQGFRKYKSFDDHLNKQAGVKVKVKEIGVPVYHYSYVRSPRQMNEKSKIFESFWHDDNYIEKKYSLKKEFDYNNIDRVKLFTGKHPAIMEEIIKKVDWDFKASDIKGITTIKKKFIYWLEDLINYRIGEYKNYKVIK